jgi:hypothetical protein
MAIDPGALKAFANPTNDPDMEPEEGDDMQEGGPGKFGMLITLLEANADDVMSLTDEFDPDILTDIAQDLDEDDQATLRDGAMTLPDDLQAELGSLRGSSLDETREIAVHLESEDVIDDVERLAGWLFRIGEVGLEAADGEDAEDVEEEPSDEEAELDFGSEEY